MTSKQERAHQANQRIRALAQYLGLESLEVDSYNEYIIHTKGHGTYIVVTDPCHIPEGRRELYRAEWLGCKDGYYIYRTLSPGQALRVAIDQRASKISNASSRGTQHETSGA